MPYTGPSDKRMEKSKREPPTKLMYVHMVRHFRSISSGQSRFYLISKNPAPIIFFSEFCALL